jgi:hypothetical protein
VEVFENGKGAGPTRSTLVKKMSGLAGGVAPTCVSGAPAPRRQRKEHIMSIITNHPRSATALGLTLAALAAAAAVAAPSANAMKAECEAHMRAAGWAYDHGMDDVGDMEYYAWVNCMRS